MPQFPDDPMKCLIVDDHSGMRQSIKQVLRGVATVTIECTDGAEAFAAYQAHRPDWVLMDVRMARMDGLTATRLIRAQYPEARVLIVTEQKAPDLREVAREAGACGFVPKEDLVQLRQILSPPTDSRPSTQS